MLVQMASLLVSQADVTSSAAFTFANARPGSPAIRLPELILRPCGFRRNSKTRPSIS
jgi:hypothetical protein